MVYESTLQAEALALVAAKMRSALMIEGELPEEGLAGMEGDGQDVMLALARRLADQSVSDGQSLEAFFARRRVEDQQNDERLTGGDWNVPESLSSADNSPCDLAGRQIGEVDVQDPLRPTDQEMGPVCTDERGPRFEDLAELLRPRTSRKRRIPEAQLPLFGA